ncbi:MAG: hypothetical protein ACTSVD_06595 [Candidatus Thorarchaeota archaeon]|nr:MAG: hypothetical protein DRO73_04820 [Candidatus Thorarchaeota archaeon]RLI61457.1 MAG: hypothetical protein DRO93_04175 [Candidatus Thorarchaeota archaeon]
MYRSEKVHLAVSPQVIVNVVRDAHGFYAENRIDERYQSVALDLVRRYVSQVGMPRETDSLFAAALYIVSRHPWSHPNPLTKTEFAARLRMKESSLEWYTDSIVEALGFIVLRDHSQLPFFVDPEGTIASVIDSIVRSSVGEEVVLSIVRGGAVSPTALAERIVDRLCNVVKIVPAAFEQELLTVVKRKIEEESQRLIRELGGR